MNLEELKKLRESNFLAHKKKKEEYYLKKKAQNGFKKIIDYEAEFNDGNFLQKIRQIAHDQKQYIDDRKDLIVKKLDEYKNYKKEYYSQHKEKRLEYDKEYREKKKEQLKEYRKSYYKKQKEQKLQKE